MKLSSDVASEKLRTFDPNKHGSNIEYATYIPGRKPEFKIHDKFGHARNSFKYKTHAILFCHDGTKWVEQFRIEDFENDPACYYCGVKRDIANSVYLSTKWRPYNLEFIHYCKNCKNVE